MGKGTQTRVAVIGSAIIAMVLMVTSCTSTPEAAPPTTAAAQASSNSSTTKKPNDTTPRGPDDTKPTETKKNKDAKPYKEVIPSAIADIQKWWASELPDVYGQDYKPIPDDSLYPATEKKPAPSCSKKGGPGTYKEIEDNAFYCSLGNFVAWDDQKLMPGLYETYGEYAVAMVFAHEWGHAIQEQVGVFGTGLPTIVTENQADCFAGAWTKHALDNKSGGFRATQSDLSSALAGMIQFRDKVGTDVNDQSAHGSGFDRINGFQTGFDEGASKCKEFAEKGTEPKFLNLTFEKGSADEANGGNAPYNCDGQPDGCMTAIEIATQDLNAYWENLGKLNKFDFKPVDSIVRFSKDTSLPKCGSHQYTQDEALNTVFYCVDDNFAAWDEDMMVDVYNEIGDFGVAVLLAKQWATSFQVQEGQTKKDIESKTGSLQESCFTGAWTRAVLEGDKHNQVQDKNGKMVAAVVLSPGDIDEAVKAFLAFSDTPDQKGDTSTGSAFEQVRAFRDGFISTQGEVVCDNYTQ